MDAVVVKVVRKRVDPVGNRRDRAACFAFRVVEQRIEAGFELLHAVPRGKFAHPAFGDAAGSLLCAQVPKYRVGDAHVARDHFEQRLVQYAPVV